MYLPGVTHAYPDEETREPTFDPDRESPDPRTMRAVLAGDRTVEFHYPEAPRMVDGNHRKQGGWFYFVAGEVLWRNRNTLTAHPTKRYIWYWPRTISAKYATPLGG